METQEGTVVIVPTDKQAWGQIYMMAQSLMYQGLVSQETVMMSAIAARRLGVSQETETVQ